MKTPKPLIPVLGAPSIAYAIQLLVNVGVRRIVVNVHSHGDQMIPALKKMADFFKVSISISDEQSLLLGSAGGIRTAMDLIAGDEFFLLNADNISDLSLIDLSARHEQAKKQQDAVMTLALGSGRLIENAIQPYTEVLTESDSGLITGLGSKRSKVPFYLGIGVMTKGAFAHLQPRLPFDFVEDVLGRWMPQRKVAAYFSDASWIDIGSPELWFAAHQAKRISVPQTPLNQTFSLSESGLVYPKQMASNQIDVGKIRIQFHDQSYEFSQSSQSL